MRRMTVDLLGDMPASRRRAVDAAVRRAGRISPAAPEQPRSGWLSALAYGVAWTYGRSVDRRALTLGAIALEGANAFVFTGISGPDGVDLPMLASWMVDRRVRAATRRLRRERAAWIRATLERLRQGRVGEQPIPEAVLSVRAAMLVGGLTGDVPTDVMAQLDCIATGLGLLWEEAGGALDEEGRRGAWAAMGTEPLDTAGLIDAVRALPHSAFAEELEALVRRLMHARLGPMVRGFPGFRPMGAPAGGPASDVLEKAMQGVLGAEPPSFVAAADALRARGGKRLRPRLVVAAYRLCAGLPSEAPVPTGVWRAAATMEWLHTASLILDDVLDASELRRGAPALHVATSTPFALAVFLWLLDRIRVAAEAVGPDVAAVVAHASERLAGGQVEELVYTGDVGVDRTVCQRIVAAKTSALFEASVVVGARCAEASEAEIAALRTYGRALGQAFQLADDVMDVTAGVEKLGKHPGTDLRAGKPTLPWVLGRACVSTDLRARLDAALGAEDPSWALSVLKQTGGVARTLAAAEAHRDDAIAALQGFSPGPARSTLVDIACTSVARAGEGV